MENNLHSPSGLYPKLLGTSWCDLDNSVRRFHSSSGKVHAVGVFQVRCGSNRLARMVAFLARLPTAGEAVDVRLEVTELEEGEKWYRTFAGRQLVSLQSHQIDGLLVERIGVIEFRFRLEVVGGALSYRTVNAALRLGSWRVRLLGWLTPCITAWERAAGEVNQIQVSVEVTSRLFGHLIAYQGMLTQIEVER